MKTKAELITLYGGTYLRLPEHFAQDNYSLHVTSEIDSNELVVTRELTQKDLSKKESIQYYWDLAAENKERELFMNTVRPLLKKKLGYNFSEVLCEEKAKLLCRKYYEEKKRGIKYQGPYLID